MNKTLRPFVKWAGGKRQLINILKSNLPNEFNTYFEPFLGGGAFLLELKPSKVIVNDYNSELVNVYNVLSNKEKINKLMKELDTYESNHGSEFYYSLRNKDRDKNKFKQIVDYKRAARTIYLNKAGFNGLYRVNSNNEFNVPFGQKKQLKTYDKDNLLAINEYLNNNDVKILNDDFEIAVKEAKKGDFVYFDPPYDSETETFNGYTELGFGKEEQKRLAKVFKKLDGKGVYVMLSNHNTSLIRDLYKEYNIKVIKAKRIISANSKNRGLVEEVIITNY